MKPTPKITHYKTLRTYVGLFRLNDEGINSYKARFVSADEEIISIIHSTDSTVLVIGKRG